MDRRHALRAAAALAVGAVPATACNARGTPHGPGPTGAIAGSATAAPSTASPPHGLPRPMPSEVTHGPRDRPAVALTFHGQGEARTTRALLGELERGGARVTVLAVGSWLQEQPAMARRILDGGHELGNHTQNHLDISGLGPADALAEITGCAQLLQRLTGSIGTWFRPSQTRRCAAPLRAQAQRVGYPSCLSYDVDSLDHTDPGAAAIVGTVGAAVRNGSIISLHCGHPGTVAAMPALLELLRGRGLRPVTMRELMA